MPAEGRQKPANVCAELHEPLGSMYPNRELTYHEGQTRRPKGKGLGYHEQPDRGSFCTSEFNDPAGVEIAAFQSAQEQR